MKKVGEKIKLIWEVIRKIIIKFDTNLTKKLLDYFKDYFATCRDRQSILIINSEPVENCLYINSWKSWKI